MSYMRLMAALLCLPAAAVADPLDRGEAYTMRAGPPKWMDGIDFAWLLVDYALFALAIMAIGWTLMKRPAAFARFEHVLGSPFRMLLRLASALPAGLRELLQGLTGLLVIALIVAWVILCQWFSHIGFGAVAMAGLALEAVLLVRLIRRGETPGPIPH